MSDTKLIRAQARKLRERIWILIAVKELTGRDISIQQVNLIMDRLAKKLMGEFNV